MKSFDSLAGAGVIAGNLAGCGAIADGPIGKRSVAGGKGKRSSGEGLKVGLSFALASISFRGFTIIGGLIAAGAALFFVGLSSVATLVIERSIVAASLNRRRALRWESAIIFRGTSVSGIIAVGTFGAFND